MKKLSIGQEANMLHTKIKAIIALHHHSDAEVCQDCDKHVDDRRFAGYMLDDLEEDCDDYQNNIYPLLVEILVYCFNYQKKETKKDFFAFYKNFFIEYYKKHQTAENEIQHHIPIFERSFAKAERVLFGA